MEPLTKEQVASIIEATPFFKEKEQELFRLIGKGDKKAEQDLIKANAFLIKNIANHYLENECNLNLEKLIEIGKTGLQKAIKKYNPQKDYKFSAYASWWIRHEIHKALGIKD